MNKGELDKSGGAQMRASCAAQMVKNGHISKWPKNVLPFYEEEMGKRTSGGMRP